MVSYEEVVEALSGTVGRWVEVSVGVPDDGGELYTVAGFAGQPTDISEAGGAGGGYWLWFGQADGPGPHWVRLDPTTFEGATFEGLPDLEGLLDIDYDDESGTNWTLRLRHHGLVTDILIYV